MNLTGRGKIYLSVIILALLFSYLIVNLNYFPYLGMAASLLLFILFAYKYKKVRTKETKLYLVFALLFSLLIFVRSEPLTSYLNFGAAIFFGFLLLLPTQEKGLGFTDYIYAAFLFIVKSVFTRSDYFLEFEKGKENSGSVKALDAVFGILVTIFLLVIILPLLSSANPFFQKMVSDFWNFLGLENLIKSIGFETIFIWLFRSIFFLFSIFIIPKLMTSMNKRDRYLLPLPFNKADFALVFPELITALVLIVFFVTQLQFYFATEETLKSLGLSHSQHTREVFTQLSLVAAIVMLLIYNGRHKTGFGKTLSWILGVQGIFLTLMALKSDFEYINAWGLTYKRLYGLTGVTWITGIFILFFENFRQKKEVVAFVKKTVIFSGAVLLIVNVLNFDYLIYHWQKARTGQGIDYTYLSSLSPDSLSYKEQILKLEEFGGDGYPLEIYNNKNPLRLIRKVENLKNKYSKLDFRTLNLLDFWQYQQIKSVDTEKFKARYENKPL